MAKMARFEIDAIVETIIEQITDSKKDSPEQVEYKGLVSTRDQLIDDIKEKRRIFNENLVEEYSKLYPKLKFNIDQYSKVVNIQSIEKPQHYIDIKTIERELIVSNVKGNVDETIKKIVEKYTK